MEKVLKSKNGIFYVVISLLAVLGLVGYAGAFVASQAVNVNEGGVYNYIESEGQPEPGGFELGAFSGPDIYEDINIHGTLITGGSKNQATTTAAGTYTLVNNDLRNYSYVDIMNNTPASSLSWTLPATSTMLQLLPEVGSSREWLFHNATTTGARTLTLVAGAGMDLIGVTANDDVIDPGEWTRLTCTQITYRAVNNENVLCIVDELGNVD